MSDATLLGTFVPVTAGIIEDSLWLRDWLQYKLWRMTVDRLASEILGESYSPVMDAIERGATEWDARVRDDDDDED